MTSKNIKNSIYFCFVVLCMSCANTKQLSFKQKVAAYSESTMDLEKYLVAIPVALGKLDGSGPLIEKDCGYIVIRGAWLYGLLFSEKYTLNNFGNYLLSLMIRGEYIYISESEYQKIKSHLVPKETAQEYLSMNTNLLLKKHFNGEFFNPSYYPNDELSLEARGILLNVLKEGYVVLNEHESGYYIYQKSYLPKW